MTNRHGLKILSDDVKMQYNPVAGLLKFSVVADLYPPQIAIRIYNPLNYSNLLRKKVKEMGLRLKSGYTSYWTSGAKEMV